MVRIHLLVIPSVLLLVLFVVQGELDQFVMPWWILMQIKSTSILGFAIKCYECNSHFHDGCGLERVSSYYTVDCSLKNDYDLDHNPIVYTFCRNITQTVQLRASDRQYAYIPVCWTDSYLFAALSLIEHFPIFPPELPNTRHIRSCGYIHQKINSCYERRGFGGSQTVRATQIIATALILRDLSQHQLLLIFPRIESSISRDKYCYGIS